MPKIDINNINLINLINIINIIVAMALVVAIFVYTGYTYSDMLNRNFSVKVSPSKSIFINDKQLFSTRFIISNNTDKRVALGNFKTAPTILFNKNIKLVRGYYMLDNSHKTSIFDIKVMDNNLSFGNFSIDKKQDIAFDIFSDKAFSIDDLILQMIAENINIKDEIETTENNKELYSVFLMAILIVLFVISLFIMYRKIKSLNEEKESAMNMIEYKENNLDTIQKKYTTSTEKFTKEIAKLKGECSALNGRLLIADYVFDKHPEVKLEYESIKQMQNKIEQTSQSKEE